MKLAMACDHGALELKNALKAHLVAEEYDI